MPSRHDDGVQAAVSALAAASGTREAVDPSCRCRRSRHPSLIAPADVCCAARCSPWGSAALLQVLHASPQHAHAPDLVVWHQDQLPGDIRQGTQEGAVQRDHAQVGARRQTREQRDGIGHAGVIGENDCRACGRDMVATRHLRARCHPVHQPRTAEREALFAHEIVELMGHGRETSSGWPQESLKGRVPQPHQPRGIEEVVQTDVGQSVEQRRRGL